MTEETSLPQTSNKVKVCDLCGKPYEYALNVTYFPDGRKVCRHDEPSRDSLKGRRNENKERSMMAMKMAAEYQKENPPDKTVTIKPPMGSNGDPMQIKESTLKSLEQKAGEFLEQTGI